MTRDIVDYLTDKLVLSFFFFQAEDGIRDLTVTGVQTCALPILPHVVKRDGRREPFDRQKLRASILKSCEKRSVGVQAVDDVVRSEEHTSELQSQSNLVCRLLLEKKNQSEQDPGLPRARRRPSVP